MLSTRYRDDPDAVRALVRPDAVHRDLYINDEVFDLEMEHLFRNTWVFVGHDSQVPEAGDYTTTHAGSEPVIMIRDNEGSVNVLLNRCAHKGTRLLSAREGNTGPLLRCPYHGWTYEHTGALKFIPIQQGYDGTGVMETACAEGLNRLSNIANYRNKLGAPGCRTP